MTPTVVQSAMFPSGQCAHGAGGSGVPMRLLAYERLPADPTVGRTTDQASFVYQCETCGHVRVDWVTWGDPPA